MAQTNALANMSKKTATKIQTGLSKATAGKNDKAKLKAISSINQYLADYTISEWYVVDSYVSDGPSYEAVYCIEASADNIITELKPYFKELDPAEVIVIVNFIKEGY